jgi:hypothetical protein
MKLHARYKNRINTPVLFITVLVLYLSTIIHSPGNHHHAFTWQDTVDCPAFLFDQVNAADPVLTFIEIVHMGSGSVVALPVQWLPDHTYIHSEIAPRAPPLS